MKNLLLKLANKLEEIQEWNPENIEEKFRELIKEENERIKKCNISKI